MSIEPGPGKGTFLSGVVSTMSPPDLRRIPLAWKTETLRSLAVWRVGESQGGDGAYLATVLAMVLGTLAFLGGLSLLVGISPSAPAIGWTMIVATFFGPWNGSVRYSPRRFARGKRSAMMSLPESSPGLFRSGRRRF